MRTDDTAVALVEAFHQAIADGDAERLGALVSEDVEVGGPRGRGRGAGLVRAWLGRAGIQLTPRRVFARDTSVVVEQDAVWHDARTGAVVSRQTVASVFGVQDGRISSVVRVDDLTAALGIAGLDTADERPGPGR